MIRVIWVWLFVCLLFPVPAFASKRVAILSPKQTDQSIEVLTELESLLSSKTEVLDRSLSDLTFRSRGFDSPFNLTTEQSKNYGLVAGCNYFILIGSDTLRRTSFERERYFESYLTVFIVSSRTGRLVFWKLKKFEEDTAEISRKKLFDSIPEFAGKMLNAVETADELELAEVESYIEELPRADAARTNGFRPPMPYRRLRPQYTKIAGLYDVAATVDILVDVDAKGNVIKTDIIRWAGFGLDKAVTETVRRMNWRPAERDGKPLSMRVLLRYNFKNLESE